MPAAPIDYGTTTGRWVVFATVLGSGVAFLDGTVVNVALPSITRDLGSGLSGLQWVLDAYLVTLSALLLLGGSLGDIYGRRRVFVIGLVAFSASSVLSGLAPTTAALVAARALQGVGAALLVPGSLAIISSSFRPEDRSRAIGAWSGLTGVSTAIGPFVGGWLIDSVSWRLVFLINLPLAALAAAVTLRHVPETRDPSAPAKPDLAGGLTASIGLGALAYALIEGAHTFGTAEMAAAVVSVAALVAFVVMEARRPEPMLPLRVFRSRQFSGANLTTLAVYGGLGATFFLLVLELQLVQHYSALAAGASLLPVTLIMLALSSRAGELAQRIGPRLPMTVGPVVVAVGLLLLSRVGATTSYFSTVLPALVVFGLGLALTVAPLTATVLAAVDEAHLGAGSGVNNAVARIAGLLAVAVLPTAAGIRIGGPASDFSAGFSRAMVISAVLCLAGAAIAFATIRTATRVAPATQASVLQPCHDPCLAEEPGASAA